MKQFIKAIPWFLLARLGFKGLSLLFVAIAAIVVFAGKIIAHAMTTDSQVNGDDAYSAYLDAGKYPHLPPTDFTPDL